MDVSANNILTIRNLTVSFAGNTSSAVDNCSFSLTKGQTHCLIGQSGSGKSTIGLAILQLLDGASVSGEIHFAGHDLLNVPFDTIRAIRGKKIGLIFQEPTQAANPLHRVRTLFHNALKAHYGHVSKSLLQDTLTRLLSQVGLEQAHQNAFPHQLSGGQLQRVMIALALVHSPSVLIADEPTTALDTVAQKNILDLLKRLQQEYQLTLLLITHNMDIVRYMAERVHVIKQGIIIEQGALADITNSPQSDYTRSLLDSTQNTISTPPTSTTQILQATGIQVKVAARNAKWWNKRTNNILLPTDFTLGAGESLGVIGASGSGKTTLGKACLRLIHAEGELLFEGHSLLQLPKSQLRTVRPRLQPVLQGLSSALNPRKSIYDTIAEGLVIQNAWQQKTERLGDDEIHKRVTESMAQVGLPADIVNRYPHQCSGGQKQRISIARSLIVRPQLMVLDEPTSALDTLTQQDILTLLATLQREQDLAYIVITHDFSVVRHLCHRVMVLDEGGVVEQGTVTQVMQQPQTEATALLLAADLRVEAATQ